MFDGAGDRYALRSVGNRSSPGNGSEEFQPSKLEKKLALLSFSWMGKRNNKKKAAA